MIELVISGGQTGADQAGWRAAEAVGLATGGWMPKGYLTEDGPRPEFRELYGAWEHHSRYYPPRTRDNVDRSFILIWFGDPKSGGGRLTLNRAASRPMFIYKVESPHGEWQPEHVARHVANAFSQEHHFPPPSRDRRRTLMIAGNRESKAPGIGQWVESYLIEVFRLVEDRT